MLPRTTPMTCFPSEFKFFAVILQKNAREAVDGAQRRTQVVRYRMGEGIQLVVGVLQMGLHLFALAEFASRGFVKLRAIDQHRELAADTGK